MSYTFHIIIHVFSLQYARPFFQKCQYHLNPFRCTTVIMSPVPQLIICEPICNFNTRHPTCTLCLKETQDTGLLIITLANAHQFPKFFHYQIHEEILYTHIIKILQLALRMFLDYLVKLENYNCCQFQWHIACDTS